MIPDGLIPLALALPLERWLGYPEALYRRIGHPVTWAGAIIAALDRGLNREAWGPRGRRVAGVLALLILLAVTGAVAWAAASAARVAGGLAPFIVALLATSLLAQRSLHEHVAAVAEGLRAGLPEGRAAVARIVGRDPESLDEAGVVRAAIESLAESLCDGIVAPALWLGAAGLPGCALYKAVNTADSMIGHLDARHGAFGWASARLDDALNIPASRLSAALLIAAAALTPGASARGAWAAVRRDAERHRSPNAGWPEAAMAGALGLRLAGPRAYDGETVPFAWMGDGREAATADIGRALALHERALRLLWALAGVLALSAHVPAG